MLFSSVYNYFFGRAAKRIRNEKKDTGNNQISECAIEKVRWQTLMGFFKGKYSYQLTTIKLLEDRNENIFPGKQMFVTIETTYTIIRGALFVIYFEITYSNFIN